MTSYLIELSKENLLLSQMEAKALLEEFVKRSSFLTDGNLLIFESNAKIEAVLKILDKLAFSKLAVQILQKEENGRELTKNLIENRYLEGINFPKESSFKITINHVFEKKSDLNVDDLAKNTYNSSGITNINLKNPDFEFIAYTAKEYYFGIRIWKNTNKFIERRADKRPESHPTSMNPRFSRAMINLANPKKEVLDPFCGSGGTLLEAGMMGLNTIGIDIDNRMIERSRKNFEHYGLKNYELVEGDALSWEKHVECVVTDVPYGRSSKLKEELKGLIEKFLIKYKELTNTIVIAFPDYIDTETIANEVGWIVLSTFSIYVHSTLTRKIMVLKNDLN